METSIANKTTKAEIPEIVQQKSTFLRDYGQIGVPKPSLKSKEHCLIYLRNLSKYQFKIGTYSAPEERYVNRKSQISKPQAPAERYRSSLITKQKLIPKMALKMNLAEISVDLYASFIKRASPPMPIINLFTQDRLRGYKYFEKQNFSSN